MNNTVIKTKNISKNFGKIRAVDSVSLNVNKGEIYGFLGMNGAGKTTTITMLLGMVTPTAGTAYLFGEEVNPTKNKLWEKVGYIVEKPYSYPNLTVEENLEITRRLRQISNKKIIEKTIDKLKLNPYQNMKAKNLSSGNAQRLGLAKALLHQPEILLLDEPTNGLDPAGIVEVRRLLADLAFNKGVTIFISSHILGEISKLATRIGVIHQGQLVQEVDRDQLDHYRKKRLLIDVRQRKDAKNVLKKAGYKVIIDRENNLQIRDQVAVEHPDKISRLLVEAGYPPTLLKVEQEDLETYFLKLIGVTGGDIE